MNISYTFNLTPPGYFLDRFRVKDKEGIKDPKFVKGVSS